MANFITHREWCEFVPLPTTTNMWEHMLFKTAKPNECTRDVVEIQTLNTETFKSALANSEASIGIFFKCLGFTRDNLHGLKFAYSAYPVIRFKQFTYLPLNFEYNSP